MKSPAISVYSVNNGAAFVPAGDSINFFENAFRSPMVSSCCRFMITANILPYALAYFPSELRQSVR